MNTLDTRTHFYHIPKTGGRSIVAAFQRAALHSLSLKDSPFSPKELKQFSDKVLYRMAIMHPKGERWKVKLRQHPGFRRNLVRPYCPPEYGQCFFTCGHTPYHDEDCCLLRKKNPTCTFTIIREPLDRIFSLYKEYLVREKREHEASLAFLDFVRGLPKCEKLEQLFYFSKKYDISEALKNLSKLTAVIICEQNRKGISIISETIGFPLKIDNEFRRKTDYVLENKEKDLVKKEIELEYELYNQAKKSS